MVLFIETKDSRNIDIAEWSKFNATTEILPFIYANCDTSCRDLISQPEIKLNNSRNLQVLQREFAVVGVNQTSLEIVGSDCATTCLVVIAKHTTSSWSLAAHLDDSHSEVQAYQIVDILKSINSEEKSFSLYLCGCFDAKHCSTSRNILDNFFSVFLEDVDEKLNITLKLALIGELNTYFEEKSNKYLPICQGIAINIKDGQVFPADFVDDPPLMELRHIKMMIDCQNSNLLKFFDAENDRIVIQRFNFDSLSCYAGHVLSMSDHEIRTKPPNCLMQDSVCPFLSCCPENIFIFVDKSAGVNFTEFEDLKTTCEDEKSKNESTSTGFERLKHVIRTFLQIKKIISTGRENRYCILTQEDDGSTNSGKGSTDADTILSELKKILPEDDESYGKSDGLNIDGILKTCFTILEPCDAPLKAGMPVDYVWRLILIISRSSGTIIRKSIKEMHEFLSDKNVFIDVLYLHEHPSPDNQVETIFKTLSTLNLNGQGYILECGPNFRSWHRAMTNLLAHPHLRSAKSSPASTRIGTQFRGNEKRTSVPRSPGDNQIAEMMNKITSSLVKKPAI